jgi:hypothetical protein
LAAFGGAESEARQHDPLVAVAADPSKHAHFRVIAQQSHELESKIVVVTDDGTDVE